MHNRLLADVFKSIGEFKFQVGTTQSLKKAKYYFEKAKYYFEKCYFEKGIDIIKQYHDMQWCVKICEIKLAKIEAILNGASISEKQAPKTEKELSSLRACYDHLRSHHEIGVGTIRSGVSFAKSLFSADHTIEAQRVLDELVVTSRRVLGSSHEETKIAVSLREGMRVRYVSFGLHIYRALRYDKLYHSGPNSSDYKS